MLTEHIQKPKDQAIEISEEITAETEEITEDKTDILEDIRYLFQDLFSRFLSFFPIQRI